MISHALRLSLMLPFLLFAASPLTAQELPSCARTGSKGVMMNGLPALRLSDVQQCPPGSYSIVNGFVVDGEPLVQFKPTGADCVAAGSSNITVNGKPVSRAGDVVCPAK